MKCFLFAVLLLFVPVMEPAAGQYLPLFAERALFDEALEKETGPVLPAGEVCGITVPHHLLAVDLIARGFRLASAGDYERVIVLFPDHFQASKSAFTTTSRGFKTVYGTVRPDEMAVAALQAAGAGESDELFISDHGIHAVLPYVAKFFPRAKLLPVALNIRSRPEQWETVIHALEPLAKGHTLVVQSTDFSHYLSRDLARERDQQSLHALGDGDAAPLRALAQPQHLDSRAAQYVHSVLQARVNGARSEAIENRNSFEYLGWEGSPTTSYIVQAYRKPRQDLLPIPAYPGQQLWYFAGDTSFGRYLAAPLQRDEVSAALRERVLAVTGGAPVVVNLEGVMLEGGVPKSLPPLLIGMDATLTLRCLKSLNVAAVSLANNHTLDFGPAALARMKELLRENGIAALEHGEAQRLGSISVLALSDLANGGEQRRNLVTDTDLENAANLRLPQPAFAFIHWGEEYEAQPGKREKFLFSELRNRGFPMVVAAHPHVASQGIIAGPGSRSAWTYSLGNFIFDQKDKKVSGSLLEVRVFAQGTCFLRMQDIGNLYVRHALGN